MTETETLNLLQEIWSHRKNMQEKNGSTNWNYIMKNCANIVAVAVIVTTTISGSS